MLLWVVMSFAMVVGVKYYTALQMRNLETRLNKVKDGLQGKKEELSRAMDRQNEVQADESAQAERIRSMKEIIQDIQIRLQGQGNEDENAMVADVMPPTAG
tara:strand:- start:152 stop:454 length:303 start_codon:yes stop_codon:yes gene_type:complete